MQTAFVTECLVGQRRLLVEQVANSDAQTRILGEATFEAVVTVKVDLKIVADRKKCTRIRGVAVSGRLNVKYFSDLAGQQTCSPLATARSGHSMSKRWWIRRSVCSSNSAIGKPLFPLLKFTPWVGRKTPLWRRGFRGHGLIYIFSRREPARRALAYWVVFFSMSSSANSGIFINGTTPLLTS